ncbi:MAG: hypothetical protein ACE5EN_11455, partial [Nitrospinota bacterium]
RRPSTVYAKAARGGDPLRALDFTRPSSSVTGHRRAGIKRKFAADEIFEYLNIKRVEFDRFALFRFGFTPGRAVFLACFAIAFFPSGGLCVSKARCRYSVSCIYRLFMFLLLCDFLLRLFCRVF